MFTGYYRAAGAIGVPVDFKLFRVDFSAEERPLTLTLLVDNGTPVDFSDDWMAYYKFGFRAARRRDGSRFSFDIDSSSKTLPAGWLTIALGPDSPQNPEWNDVNTNGDQLGYLWGARVLLHLPNVGNRDGQQRHPDGAGTAAFIGSAWQMRF